MTPEHKVKSKKLEAAIIFIVAMLVVLYFYPRLVAIRDERQNDRVSAVCKEFLKVTLERSAKNKNLEEVVAHAKVELGVGDVKCPLCTQAEFDPKTRTAIVTGYDKNEDVVIRISINPPSFVQYER